MDTRIPRRAAAQRTATLFALTDLSDVHVRLSKELSRFVAVEPIYFKLVEAGTERSVTLRINLASERYLGRSVIDGYVELTGRVSRMKRVIERDLRDIGIPDEEEADADADDEHSNDGARRHSGAQYDREPERYDRSSVEHDRFEGTRRKLRARLPVRIFVENPKSATLHVTVSGEGGVPVPAAIVYVNEREVGETGEDGSLTVEVDPGETYVSALGRRYGGSGSLIEVRASETTTANLKLSSDGLSLLRRYKFVLDQAVGGRLESTFQALSFRFVDSAGRTVPIANVNGISIEAADAESAPAPILSWDLFLLRPDGVIVVADVAGFKAAIASLPSEVVLRVNGDDRVGFGYEGRLKFEIY